MKHRLFHHWMTRSALAATLALVLVPTLGRLVGLAPMPMHHAAMHTAAPGGGDGAMPDMHGHAMAHAGIHTGHTGHAPDATGGDHHSQDEDCDYCALLLGATSLPVPYLRTPLPPRSVALAVPGIRTVVLDRHPTGLGSRGPPLAG